MKLERLRRGWTQTDLAARAGKLSSADISRFEHGRSKPYPGQALRLGAALELPPDELLEPIAEQVAS